MIVSKGHNGTDDMYYYFGKTDAVDAAYPDDWNFSSFTLEPGVLSNVKIEGGNEDGSPASGTFTINEANKRCRSLVAKNSGSSDTVPKTVFRIANGYTFYTKDFDGTKDMSSVANQGTLIDNPGSIYDDDGVWASAQFPADFLDDIDDTIDVGLALDED